MFKLKVGGAIHVTSHRPPITPVAQRHVIARLTTTTTVKVCVNKVPHDGVSSWPTNTGIIIISNVIRSKKPTEAALK